MNLLGISMGMGARDVGMKAAVGSATKNLDKLNGLLEDQSDIAGKSKIGGLFDRIQGFNIATIASKMRDLTGETGNLTNGLEAMGVANAQAVKPIVAQMNLTAAAARKMTSRMSGMAIGLNVGATEVAETFKGIHNAAKPAKDAIDAMGLSERSWVKITTTTGVSMQDYAGLLGDMVASWGAAPEQAAGMLNNLMDIGKQAKIGTLAIRNAKTELDALDAIFEKLPPSMTRSADEMQSLMQSTYKLAGAFREMGETEEMATELGQQTANMFAEQAVAITRWQMGIGSAEDSPLYQWLTTMGTTSQDAIDIIQTGSRDAVRGAQMLQGAMAEGIAKGTLQADAAISMLNESMGGSAAGLSYLITNLDTGTAALDKMANMTVKGENALKKYGDAAHSSGRTLQESLDLAKEAFQTQFRAIGRGDVRKFVGEDIKAYKRMGKKLRELGSDETWGPVLKKMAIFDQMGARGVFLSFAKDLGLSTEKARDVGIALELAVGTAQKVSDEFGPIFELMGQLGPLGTLGVVGGVASFFLLDESDRKEIFGSFAPIVETIGEKVKEIWDGLPWDKIKTAFDNVMDKVGDYVSRVVDKVLLEITDWLVKSHPTFAKALGLDKAAKQMRKEEMIQTRAEKLLKEQKQALPMGATEFTSVFDVSNKAEAVDLARQQVAQEEKLAAAQKKRLEAMQEGRVFKGAVSKAKAAGRGPKGAIAAGERAAGQHRIMREALKMQAGESDLFKQMWSEDLSKMVGPFGWIGSGLEVLKSIPLIEQRSQEFSGRLFAIEAMSSGSITNLKNTGQQTVATLQDTFDAGWNVISQASSAGGRAAVEMFGTGVEEGEPVTLGVMGEVLQRISNFLGGSLPTEGPLANGDPAYYGALSIMTRFMDGLYDSTEAVRVAMEQTLDDSVILTIETYAAKMDELMQKKPLLRNMAKQMVKDFGGKMEMGTVDVDGEKMNAKATFEAAMNIPGMGGVIAAVISSGHQTQKILKKIQEDTSAIRESDLIKHSKVGPGGQVNVVLSS